MSWSWRLPCKPGFHLQQTPRPRHKNKAINVVEQSSLPLIALFWLKIGRYRGRNMLCGHWDCLALKPSFHLQQTLRPWHKKQSDYVVVWVVILPTNRFVLAQNWSLSWPKLAQWKPSLRPIMTTTTTDLKPKQSDWCEGWPLNHIIALLLCRGLGFCCVMETRLKKIKPLGLVSITRQMPRPQHKNKAITRLSSHPSR